MLRCNSMNIGSLSIYLSYQSCRDVDKDFTITTLLKPRFYSNMILKLPYKHTQVVKIAI